MSKNTKQSTTKTPTTKTPLQKQQTSLQIPVQQQKQVKPLLSKQQQWQQISSLNKLYKVDRILLKHAYKIYPGQDKSILQENVKQYKNIEKFYRFVLDNLFNIQKSYLTDNDVLEGQEDNNLKDNYQINKNNTSKFIRDEHEGYKKILASFSEKVNEDQYGINGLKIYQFVKQAFNTQFTTVLINGQQYFNNKSTNKQQFQNNIKQYFLETKEVQENSYDLANVWLSQEQILDFLSYWLKSYGDQNMYVLYCRTQEKLKKDVQYLKSQAELNKAKQQKGETILPAAHPVNLRKQQFEKMQIIQQKIQSTIQQQNVKEKFNQVITQSQKKMQPKITNIFQKFRKNKFVSQNAKQYKTQAKTKQPLSKKQQLMEKAPQYFVYGCKKRYPLPKGTTFDQIQEHSKTMNLQKFINFCKHFGLNQYLSRQLLSQMFKISAINRLVIDQQRFIKILETMIQVNQKVIDCFLDKKVTKNPKLKSQSKLSSYKFMLRPVNGKSIQTLETQLQEKKIVKSKSKQQKLNLYFLKKLKQKSKGDLQIYKKQKTVLSSRVLPQQTNLLQLQNIRDDRFDPQKFFGEEQDQLLQMYQSKMQNSKNNHPSTLQLILSKRLQKGQKILKKINSSSLKYYQ